MDSIDRLLKSIERLIERMDMLNGRIVDVDATLGEVLNKVEELDARWQATTQATEQMMAGEKDSHRDG